MQNRGLHGRGVTSLIVLTNFMVMTVTGIVLYFAPHGRVAYWVDWHFTGLTRTGWINMHIISSLVFAAAGCFHLYFNWKPLMNYLSGKVAGTLKYKKELALAAVLTVLVVTGSIYMFPPFNYVIDFGEHLKRSWVKSRHHDPPFGHAEELSLQAFARRMNIDLTQTEARLQTEGIRYDSVNDKLKDIAEANGITPMDIYVTISHSPP